MVRGVVFASWLLALSGCRAPTQVKLELSTDADCSDVIGTTITTGLLAELDGRPPTTQTTTCDSLLGRLGSLVVIPEAENDADFAVRVVTGFYKTPQQCVDDGYRGGCIVARRALRFIPNTTIDLPIVMEAACIDVPCEATQTCRQGTCVSAQLDDPLQCSDPAGCDGHAGAGGASAIGAEGGATGAHGGTEATAGGASDGSAGGGAGEPSAEAGAGGASEPQLPVSHWVEVTTVADVLDGDVRSLGTLLDDPGPDQRVSLREALLAANATPNEALADRVDFAIPGAAPYGILVTGEPLPGISDPVTLDATTQPGYAGWPVVEVLGNALTAGHGLSLLPGSDGTTIRGFAIGGFPDSGIHAESCGGHTIALCNLGVRADGVTRAANTTALYLAHSGGNRVGGDLFGENVARNVLSGSRGDGLLLEGPQSRDNIIMGNLIGLDASGLAALPNLRHGVLLRSGASFNTVGGDDPLQRNVISANAANGVRLSDAMTEGNVVQGNLIGSNSAFSVDDQLGNGWAGIRITVGAHHNLIGGVGAWRGNVIYYNLLAGIEISGVAPPQHNAVLGNNIALNGTLGINLRADGMVTVNDPGDVDVGANQGLNFPHWIVASYAAGRVNVDYNLDVPAGDYRVEFFSSFEADPSGYGPGETLVHAELITHVGNGSETLQAAFDCDESAFITATTTFIEPAGGYGATSEFSAAIPTTYTGFAPY